MKELGIGVKYGIVCLQFLLHSWPVECWRNDKDTFSIFKKIIDFGLDERSIVWMQAIRSFVILCSNSKKDVLVKAFSEFEDFAIKVLEEAEVKQTSR